MKNNFLARSAALSLRIIGFKRTSWNVLCRNGVTYGGAASPAFAALISDSANGGVIVEHGCGIGTLPAQLRPGSFRQYIGYDIGDEQIRIAAKNAPAGCTFHRSSMESWTGESQPIDLIVCKEVVYYLSQDALHMFLVRAKAALSPTGRIVITIHDRNKWTDVIAACHEHGAVEVRAGGAVVLVISKPTLA